MLHLFNVFARPFKPHAWFSQPSVLFKKCVTPLLTLLLICIGCIALLPWAENVDPNWRKSINLLSWSLAFFTATRSLWWPDWFANGRSSIALWLYRLSYVAIVLWLLTVSSYWFTTTYVPDEGLCFSLARMPLDNPWAPSNILGYGGLFWAYYHGLFEILQLMHPVNYPAAESMTYRLYLMDLLDIDPLAWMPLFWVRLTAVLALSSVFICLLKLSKKDARFSLVLLFLLGFPWLYWSGKIASPELIAGSIVLLGIIHYFYMQRPAIGALCIGIACSMKPTIAPLAAAWLLIVLIQYVPLKSFSFRRIDYKPLLLAYALFSFGFFFMSPTALFAPHEFIKAVSINSQFQPAPLPIQLELIFYKNNPTWDHTSYGSLNSFSGGLYLSLFLWIFAIGATIRQRNIFCAWYVLASVLMVIFLIFQPPHNWYLIPLIGASALIFSQWPKNGLILGVIFCLLHAAIALPLIFEQLQFIQDRQNAANNQPIVQACLEKVLARYSHQVNFGTLYDGASIGRATRVPGFIAHVNYVDTYIWFWTGANPRHPGDVLILNLPLHSSPAEWVLLSVRERVAPYARASGHCGPMFWVLF